MSLINRLRKREEEGRIINVAVVGAGLIGRGTAHQVEIMPAMRTALIVNRTIDRAVQAFELIGHDPCNVVVSRDPVQLQKAIDTNQSAVTDDINVLRELPGIEVVVEVTGAVEYGANVALCAIESGKHIIMMNAETDVTVGCRLKQLADDAGVVYSNSDGDQPGVLNRLIDFVKGIGLEIVAAVNCKGFMDRFATPDSIRVWAEKQNTSLPMTTAFTDGTKMNIENAVLANATGLIPARRGMYGVDTTQKNALRDCLETYSVNGIVDYTLGGDFGGGVFVIGRGDDPIMMQPYLKYLKMGDGPNYLFYRPYHLCHFETPLSIAEAVLDHEPTIAPLGRPVAEVVAVAKRDLKPDDRLDGIGGFMCFGEIDTAENTRGLLPMGMTDNVRVLKSMKQGDPITLDAVEFDRHGTLHRLYDEQNGMLRAAA